MIDEWSNPAQASSPTLRNSNKMALKGVERRLSISAHNYYVRTLTKFETILHFPEVDNFIFETTRRNHENSSDYEQNC